MSNLVKVYGFPRSGNHLVMELLGRNFYPDADLQSPGGQVGHWAHRAEVPPVEFGKLAGHHGPPEWGYEDGRSVYVFRDGRAVAASLWRSPHFKHPKWKGGSFSDFIRAPLDWQYSPGVFILDEKNNVNVIEHWRDHLQAWHKTDVLKVRYEELVRCPEHFLELFQWRFNFQRPKKWHIPEKLVGWFPSGGCVDGWRSLWSREDEHWFYEQIPKGHYGLEEYAEV